MTEHCLIATCPSSNHLNLPPAFGLIALGQEQFWPYRVVWRTEGLTARKEQCRYTHMKSDDDHSLSQCSECACFNVRKAARAITRFYDSVLEPSGIQGTQFSLLTVAHLAGELPITETADRLGLDRTTLTRNLKVLEARGLIAVGPGKDGRTKSIKVTVAGRDALKKALPYWKTAQQLVVRDLGHSRFKTLLKELDAIRTVSKQSLS